MEGEKVDEKRMKTILRRVRALGKESRETRSKWARRGAFGNERKARTELHERVEE